MFTKIETLNDNFNDALREVVGLVRMTMGPFGGNVSTVGGRERLSFDDGKRAVEMLQSKNPYLMEASRRVLDAQVSQVNTCGDGTSTTAVLLEALYFAGLRLVMSGYRRRAVISAFQQLCENACKDLDKMAKGKYEEGVDIDAGLVTAVATIAMHGDGRLGALIGGLVAEMGPYGMVTAEMGIGSEVTVSRGTGYSWRQGVADGVFFNRPGIAQYEDSLLVLVNEVCNDIQTDFWNSVFGAWHRERQRTGKDLALVLVSRGAEGSVSSTFAARTFQGAGGQSVKMPMLILRPPGETAGECEKMLSDIAAVTGATLFDQIRGRMGGKDFDTADFGRVAGVSATIKSSTLRLYDDVADFAVSAETRSGEVEDEYVADGGVDDVVAQNEKRNRLAALNGGVGIIRLPATSETQFNEMREMLEDGCRAAMSSLDGVVPGGGKALAWAGMQPDDGVDPKICAEWMVALDAPMKALWDNFEAPIGVDMETYFEAGREWVVVDFNRNLEGDAIVLGVLDSAKVQKSALINAMSVAMPLLNTSVWLVRDDG